MRGRAVPVVARLLIELALTVELTGPAEMADSGGEGAGSVSARRVLRRVYFSIGVTQPTCVTNWLSAANEMCAFVA